MDQPQNVKDYFSKNPTPGYEERTDLILTLRDHSDSAKPVTARRAQIAVDLASTNPEANETVNVFYAAHLVVNRLDEFSFTLEVDAQDFEIVYGASASLVFVSDRSESRPRLYFLPLGADFKPAGPAEPLTDGVITDPRRPSISADGRFVIFDADDYQVSTRQRIYTLDLRTAAVRRLTVDPFSGVSYDLEGSLNVNRTHFTMITNRSGTPSRLNIQEVTSGLGSGTGNSVAVASSADWNHTRNEIAYADSTGLWLLDVETNDKTKLVSGTNIRDVKFAPCAVTRPQRIAYVADNGLNVVNRDGSGNELILTDGDHPAWIDEDYLIIQRNVGGNTDLYLVNLDTKQTIRLTTDPAADTEPAATYYCIYLPIIQKDYKPTR
jgi:Tol biopolymer transport system component